MSQPLVRADNPYSIFRLPEALTCWPAVSVMAASFLVAALVFALGGALARVWMGFTVLLALVAIVVGLAGISGAGACLSELARKRPYRGLVGYFIAGLLCLPKLLGAGLLMMLAALALFLALAVVFFICKIPVLGPLLLVVVVPVAVLAMAALMLALYVASSIVGPALWDGERVMHSLSITWHITRKYPFAAIGKIVGGMLLSAIFASMLFGLITSASFTVGGLFAAVVGMGGDFGGGTGGRPVQRQVPQGLLMRKWRRLPPSWARPAPQAWLRRAALPQGWQRGSSAWPRWLQPPQRRLGPGPFPSGRPSCCSCPAASHRRPGECCPDRPFQKTRTR